MIKLVKEQNKSQLKYYQVVPYTIKKLLSIKDILKTLPSSGINNYIKILQRQRCRKAMEKDGKRCKMEKDKIVLRKVPPVQYL